MSSMRIPDIIALVRRYRHLVTIQNAGLAVALLIAAGWMWGAVNTLQRNYQYQRQVDANDATIKLMKMQNQNYTYQQAYLKSAEYLELSARSEFGLALPGEYMVILPSSENIKDTVPVAGTVTVAATAKQQSNLSRWMDFFFGKH